MSENAQRGMSEIGVSAICGRCGEPDYLGSHGDGYCAVADTTARMKLVLVGPATDGEVADLVLLEDASGVWFNDCTIFTPDGKEIANWSFSEGGVAGWFPEPDLTRGFDPPQDFYARAEFRA